MTDPFRHQLRNTVDEAPIQALDPGKTTEERNINATSFFWGDPTYGLKHYDTRNKVLPSTWSMEDYKILNLMQTK